MSSPPEPAAYRLAAVAGRYRWSVDHREVASALWREHCWDVHHNERDRVLISLVAGSERGPTRVALVDHEGRRIAAFTAAEPMSRSHIGAVTDGYGETMMVVRADGPTGLHVIDPAGTLLLLTSRHRGRDAHGSDVLVTGAGSEHGTGLILGVTLALELLRSGALRRVA